MSCQGPDFFSGIYIDGVLIEAKGFYKRFVDKEAGVFKGWFRGQKSLVRQARRQLEVANGTPIRWHINEEETLNAIDYLFQQNDIEGIELVHTPMK